jgi:hypothetical protein
MFFSFIVKGFGGGSSTSIVGSKSLSLYEKRSVSTTQNNFWRPNKSTTRIWPGLSELIGFYGQSQLTRIVG